MTNTQIAWLAGFMDGEGHIGIRFDSKANNGRGTFSLQVRVSNTDCKTMEWVASLTGCRLYYTQYHLDRRRYTNNDKWKPVWTCVWLARRATDFLNMLLPYLVTKKERAELAIEFQTRLSRERGRKGKPSSFTDTERQAYHDQMRTFNKKTTA